jgi:dTDP-4-dehydrorhamnose 3,5-epimerase
MKITSLPLNGALRLATRPNVDERGWFGRIFCAELIRSASGQEFALSQANISHNERAGAWRGLHFQVAPHAEAKVVRCIQGRILDVIVDIRRASPTFLEHHAEELSAENRAALYIPKGFAHGFQVLSDGATLLYLHDAPFNAEASRAINVKSPVLGIELPLPVGDVSNKDAAAEMIDQAFKGLEP